MFVEYSETQDLFLVHLARFIIGFREIVGSGCFGRQFRRAGQR